MAGTIEQALRIAQRAGVAVVGASPKAERVSNMVMRECVAGGLDCAPVNPAAAEVLGRRCFATLAEYASAQKDAAPPRELGVVCVFRNDPTEAIREALALQFPCVWLQQGLHVPQEMQADVDAAQAERGVVVVEDRCLKVEWARKASELSRM